MSSIRQEASDVYASFISAFTFTLAVTTVDNIVQANSYNLIVLAMTMLVATCLLTGSILGMLQLRESLLVPGVSPSNQLLLGPTHLILFLIQTARSIAVHFMSTVIGRWVLLLNTDDTDPDSLIPTIVIGMSLLWLLGRAAGAT